MDSKMTKKLWVAMIATFLIGIFALAVQPTAANTSQVDQQVVAQSTGLGSQVMFVFDRWIGMLAGVGLVLIIVLVTMIIMRRRALHS